MTEQEQNKIHDLLNPVCSSTEILSKMTEFFIFPLLFFAPDGTLLYVNNTFLLKYNLVSADLICDDFNIYKNPIIRHIDKKDMIKKAFSGETVFLTDVDIDINELVKGYGSCGLNSCSNFMDIVLFPIKTECDGIMGVTVILSSDNIKEQNEVIVKAKKFIEHNHMNKFIVGEVSDYLHFSKSYFIKLFRNSTGMTPHEYLISYKLELVKEKLVSTDMTVKQAFYETNLIYNGHMAEAFKKKFGRLPLSYKRAVIKGE